MNDDFDGSDLGALFAEVDRLEAQQTAPAHSVRQEKVSQQHTTYAPGYASPAVTASYDSNTPQLLKPTEMPVGPPAPTPRSSKEIRSMFSKKRPTPEQEAAAHQPPAAQGQQVFPQSRFQPQAAAQPGPHVLTSMPVHTQSSMYDTSVSASYQQGPPVQPSQPPHARQQPPTMFNAFAYQHPVPVAPSQQTSGMAPSAIPGHSQSAAMQHRSVNAPQPLSHSGHMRNSGTSSGNASARHASQHSGPPARHSTASVTAGPAWRAELHVGEAATIEVNVRPHDNVAAVLRR